MKKNNSYKEEDSSIKDKIKQLLKNKRFLYLGGTALLLVFTIALNIAFSSFLYRDSDVVANIKVADMKYTMKLDGSSGRITKGNANDVTLVEVEITALNKYASKYELIYKVCTTSSCTAYKAIPNDFEVMYDKGTEAPVVGEVSDNGTKTITIAIINDTASDIWIELGVNAGYVHNTLTLAQQIINEYEYIPEKLANAILESSGGESAIVELPVGSFGKNATNTGSETSTNTKLENDLFKVSDDYGTSYYYRGAINNNWVEFAGFYWRIIRIDGNGDIRMIYNGIADGNPQATGTATQIPGTHVFSYNDLYDDNMYVGFKYGTSGGGTGTNDIEKYLATHTQENPSNAYTQLMNWYNTNIASQGNEVTDKIVQDAVFCGDRNMRAGDKGYAKNATNYGANVRLTGTNKTPTLSCYNTVGGLVPATNDQYIVPIALITADEIAYAGGRWSGGNAYWLATGENYWTMTPYNHYGGGSYATVFSASSTAYLTSAYYVNSALGLRGVLALHSDVAISGGNGTMGSPYIIQ